MKKLACLLPVLFSMHVYAQHINVSTGAGSAASGLVDANWKVGLAAPATGPSYTIASYPTFWEPSPVSGTGARWINVVNGYGTPGQKVYIYERKIPVGPGIKKLSYSFSIGFDDVLNGLELVKPNGSAIALNAVPVANYKLSKVLNDSINCPAPGDWTIRAKVFCADKISGPSGFILSGYMDLVAGGGCAIINYNPCCPPWNMDILKSSMKYEGVGSISDPYTLVFQPDALYQSQMQAYINYLHLINPAITTIATEFRLHDMGTGNPPFTSGWGPMIGGVGFCKYTWNTTGASSLTPASPIHFFPIGSMVVGTWYAVPTGTYLNDNIKFFPGECADNAIYVRIQVLNAKAMSPNQKQAGNAVLEFSNGREVTGSSALQ